jgi:hypothetical protein
VGDTHDLEHLVRQATANMSAEYERMRRMAKEDPGTSGDQGEENWADLLSKWLPGTFHVVTKGRIISSTGQTSGQLDVLVLSPSYPMGLLSNKLYIAAGVVAAFECKRTLRREHIRKTVRTGVKLSRMIQSDRFVPHHILYGLLAQSYQLSSIRKSPVTVVAEALQQADAEEVNDPHDCLDFVCVPNLGTWFLLRFAHPRRPQAKKDLLTTTHMGPISESGHRNDDAIGQFLVALLERISHIDNSMSAIAHYLGAADAGLATSGQGKLRTWEFDGIPEDLQRPTVTIRKSSRVLTRTDPPGRHTISE